MKKLTDDPAVRAFIRRRVTPESFTHLAAEIREQFGLDLTPQAVSHLWRTLRQPRIGKPSTFERNAAVMAWIADHADLMTLDELGARIAQAFGRHMRPSRSHLHRLVIKLRDEAERAWRDGAA